MSLGQGVILSSLKGGGGPQLHETSGQGLSQLLPQSPECRKHESPVLSLRPCLPCLRLCGCGQLPADSEVAQGLRRLLGAPGRREAGQCPGSLSGPVSRGYFYYQDGACRPCASLLATTRSFRSQPSLPPLPTLREVRTGLDQGCERAAQLTGSQLTPGTAWGRAGLADRSRLCAPL